MEKVHAGECFCGAVAFEVSGDPAGMGYCHCDSCRHWSAGPVNAFTLWGAGNLRITRGSAHIGTYAKSPRSQRKWCTNCGGHLFTEHPHWQLVDVYAALLPTLEFVPGVQVNCADAVLDIPDGNPRFRDFPAELGGSGEQLGQRREPAAA